MVNTIPTVFCMRMYLSIYGAGEEGIGFCY